MSLIDPATGEPRWTRPTQGGRLAAVSDTKLYLRSYNLDLFVMDRKTGRMSGRPGREPYRVPGLNLRDYDLDIVNRFNDRIYFATSSGMIVCLRETGQPQPRPLKDPKALPFGYVPPEGLKPTPPAAPAAEPGAEPKNERGGDAPRADKDKAAASRQGKGSRPTPPSNVTPDSKPPSLFDLSLDGREGGRRPGEGAFVG